MEGEEEGRAEGGGCEKGEEHRSQTGAYEWRGGMEGRMSLRRGRYADRYVWSQDAHLQLNHAVEIIGKVQNDLSVRVMACSDLGPEGDIGESTVVSLPTRVLLFDVANLDGRLRGRGCGGGRDASVSSDLL